MSNRPDQEAAGLYLISDTNMFSKRKLLLFPQMSDVEEKGICEPQIEKSHCMVHEHIKVTWFNY